MASAATGDPYTYAEAMESPQRNYWKRAMDEESTSILLNNTFSALNSQEARQLQVKLIGSKWVYKTKHNPDGSTRYKARLVIQGYEQTDFGETSVSNGSGPPLWVRVQVKTERLPIWRSGLSTHRNCQFGTVQCKSRNPSALGGLSAGRPAGPSVDLYNVLVFAFG
jgi:hypothetical protein